MNTLPKYSQQIDSYFAPYRTHSAVQMAEALQAKQGVSFDAVMAMAISVSEPPGLRPLVPFTSGVPEARWGGDGEAFLRALRDFYRDSKFEVFYATHQEFYRIAEARFAATMREVDFSWYPRFYGSAPDLKYQLIIAMNNGGGNYGPHLDLGDGRSELFSIIGCWTHDDAGDPTYPTGEEYLPTIIHEFNHSFVNPAVHEHWSEFSGADQVFASVRGSMQRMAYGSTEMMVDESLVRAAVIVYFRQAGEDAAKNQRRVTDEQRNGFVWMDELIGLLEQYYKKRAAYPTFASYMPQMGQFYRELPTRLTGEMTAFEAKSAHVVKLEPFANHAQDVDPRVRVIAVIFDKQLDAKAGYSVNYGEGGKEHYPITGQPTFEQDGHRLLLPVDLKPNQPYNFVLTSRRFRTMDGHPLASYAVEFRTR